MSFANNNNLKGTGCSLSSWAFKRTSEIHKMDHGNILMKYQKQFLRDAKCLRKRHSHEETKTFARRNDVAAHLQDHEQKIAKMCWTVYFHAKNKICYSKMLIKYFYIISKMLTCLFQDMLKCLWRCLIPCILLFQPANNTRTNVFDYPQGFFHQRNTSLYARTSFPETRQGVVKTTGCIRCAWQRRWLRLDHFTANKSEQTFVLEACFSPDSHLALQTRLKRQKPHRKCRV